MKQIKNYKKAEKTDLEYLVLKNFIGVLKQNGMYPMFRCVVGSNTQNVVSSIYRRMPSFGFIIRNQSKENIYRDAGNIDAFIEMMKSSFEGGINKNETDPAKLQKHIANCVNMLLHIFVERNIRDFRKLESLGAEIFDRTCREVFGGEFQDVLPAPQNIEEMRNINQRLFECGGKPTPELMEEIRSIMERQQQMQQQQMFQAPDGYGVPPINQNDWDFLDDFLEEHEDEEYEDGEDEDFYEGDDEGFEGWDN